jgi:hypothetical protein
MHACVVPLLHRSAACSAYGTQPVVLADMAHDVMLDTRWEEAAQALQRWLDKTV